MAPTGITGNMETLASVDTFIIHWDFGESGSSYNIDVVSMTNTTSGEPGSSTRSGFEILRSNSLNWPLNIQQLVVGHISYSTIVIGPFKLCKPRMSSSVHNTFHSQLLTRWNLVNIAKPSPLGSMEINYGILDGIQPGVEYTFEISTINCLGAESAYPATYKFSFDSPSGY